MIEIVMLLEHKSEQWGMRIESQRADNITCTQYTSAKVEYALFATIMFDVLELPTSSSEGVYGHSNMLQWKSLHVGKQISVIKFLVKPWHDDGKYRMFKFDWKCVKSKNERNVVQDLLRAEDFLATNCHKIVIFGLLLSNVWYISGILVI